MSSVRQAEPSVGSKETCADERDVNHPNKPHDGAVGLEEKVNEDDGPPPLHSESSDHEAPKEFKEGGYGWIVVLAVFLINMHTWGLNSAYAVFLAYYLNSDTFPGASPIAFAFVGGLSISIALLFAPLATIVIGKFGTRTCLQIGVLLETAAFIGASFTTQIWHLVLSQGIAFGAGMGFLFTGSVGLLPQWFARRRSLANSIGTAGSGFGGLAYSLAANAMLRDLGLAWAFRILAILAFVVNGGCSFLARDRNKEVGAVHSAFHRGFGKRVEVYLFLAWAGFSILGYIIVVFSLASYASAVGFTSTQGSILAAVFNLSQGLGRPLIGFYSDRVGRINIAAICSLVASLAAFFLWIFAGKHYAGAIIYSLFGACAGGIWPCIAPVAVEVMGLQLLPSVMSITWLVLVLPATFAEVIGLSLVTPGKDGYLHVQVYTGCMFMAAFAFILALRVWKIHAQMSVDSTKEDSEEDARNVDGGLAAAHRPNLTFAFAVKACFCETKV